MIKNILAIILVSIACIQFFAQRFDEPLNVHSENSVAVLRDLILQSTSPKSV